MNWKMKKIMGSVLLSIVFMASASAQNVVKIKNEPGEWWWSTFVPLAYEMPFEVNTPRYDIAPQTICSQIPPVMLSSNGRFIRTAKPFDFQFVEDTLIIESIYEDVEVQKVGSTLRQAFFGAFKESHVVGPKHYDIGMFFNPQYRVSVEDIKTEYTNGIASYADAIKDNNFPTGFLVLDDWETYLGKFELNEALFSDAAKTMTEVHEKGFKVLLSIAPFVAVGTVEYNHLSQKGFLIKDKQTSAPAVVTRYDEAYACYDLTNPAVVTYLRERLDDLITNYNVDGFKFDIAGIDYQSLNYQYYNPNVTTSDLYQAWADLASEYPLSEFINSWIYKKRGYIRKKSSAWLELESMVSKVMVSAFFTPYTCLDMLGSDLFIPNEEYTKDMYSEQFIVRAVQVQSLMPIMQVPGEPWKHIDKKYQRICIHFIELHKHFAAYIEDALKRSAESGAPIIRNLEYEFPHQGYDLVRDQFMLGKEYMIAPMVDRGYSRLVKIPRGTWIDDLGEQHIGPKVIKTAVPIERLPYYKLVK